MKKAKKAKAKKAKKAKKASTGKPSQNRPAGAKKKAASKKAPIRKRAAKKPGRSAMASGFKPPHKCQEVLNGCLMFFPDSNGHYNTPAGGKAVDCSECQYWF
jgi:hypothetical protein